MGKHDEAMRMRNLKEAGTKFVMQTKVNLRKAEYVGEVAYQTEAQNPLRKTYKVGKVHMLS